MAATSGAVAAVESCRQDINRFRSTFRAWLRFAALEMHHEENFVDCGHPRARFVFGSYDEAG
jgi:hypothetical protein